MSELGVLPRHPPITEVAVFSTTPITHILISPLLYGAERDKWITFRLAIVGKIHRWIEYRAIDWMITFPDCLLVNSGCDHKKSDDKTRHARTTFFDRNDCYGYFRDTSRIGYSVNEGNDFFVNYLGPPTVWEHSNHCSGWPPQFRREVWEVLLCCKRLGGAWRNLATVIIEKLAKIVYLTDDTD